MSNEFCVRGELRDVQRHTVRANGCVAAQRFYGDLHIMRFWAYDPHKTLAEISSKPPCGQGFIDKFTGAVDSAQWTFNGSFDVFQSVKSGVFGMAVWAGKRDLTDRRRNC